METLGIAIMVILSLGALAGLLFAGGYVLDKVSELVDGYENILVVLLGIIMVISGIGAGGVFGIILTVIGLLLAISRLLIMFM